MCVSGVSYELVLRRLGIRVTRVQEGNCVTYIRCQVPGYIKI